MIDIKKLSHICKMIKTNEDWYPSYKLICMDKNNNYTTEMCFKCALGYSYYNDSIEYVVSCSGLDDEIYCYYTHNIIDWLKAYRKVHDFITKKQLKQIGFIN